MSKQLECIEFCLEGDEEQDESLWIRIKGKANMGDTVVSVHYRLLDQDEEVKKAFCRQLNAASRSHVLFLMEDCNHSDISWKVYTAGHTLSPEGS